MYKYHSDEVTVATHDNHKDMFITVNTVNTVEKVTSN